MLEDSTNRSLDRLQTRHPALAEVALAASKTASEAVVINFRHSPAATLAINKTQTTDQIATLLSILKLQWWQSRHSKIKQELLTKVFGVKAAANKTKHAQFATFDSQPTANHTRLRLGFTPQDTEEDKLAKRIGAADLNDDWFVEISGPDELVQAYKNQLVAGMAQILSLAESTTSEQTRFMKMAA